MKIRHLKSSVTHTLLSAHLVGRADDCALRIDNRLVSNRHAEFRWTGAAWELHDLRSNNGTFVNGERLTSRRRLEKGMRIAFGDSEDGFEIMDIEAPMPRAVRDDGAVVEGEGGLLCLPGPDNPELSVFERGNGQWLIEHRSGDPIPAADGDEVQAGSHSWTLHLPAITEATWQAGEQRLMLRNVTFRFLVGCDGQNIDIEIRHGAAVFFWPARAHHKLLLYLASQRLEDQSDPDLAEAETGWVFTTDLLHEQDITDNTLHAHIFRARKKLGEMGVLGAADIVQRRSGSGQLRIGVSRLEVVFL